MSIKSIVAKQAWSRLIAIDPASHSLAWAVIDTEKNVLATGKIDLKKEIEEDDFNEAMGDNYFNLDELY